MNSQRNVAELKRLLEQTDDRASLSARLRPLMPYIQARVSAGSPYAAILDDLEKAGLPIKRRLLERALYRWRKSTAHSTERVDTPRPTEPIPSRVPTLSHARGMDHPPRIETPADLRKIRDKRVDLDALRRAGEARKKAENSACHRHNLGTHPE